CPARRAARVPPSADAGWSGSSRPLSSGRPRVGGGCHPVNGAGRDRARLATTPLAGCSAAALRSRRGGRRAAADAEECPRVSPREDSMAERVVNARDVTLDEVRARAAVAGLVLREERLEMVRLLLADALAPLRRTDTHAVRTVEPAVTFDAGAGQGSDHAGR